MTTVYSCFWCGDVAVTGPWKMDHYTTDIHLCGICTDKHREQGTIRLKPIED